MDELTCGLMSAHFVALFVVSQRLKSPTSLTSLLTQLGSTSDAVVIAWCVVQLCVHDERKEMEKRKRVLATYPRAHEQHQPQHNSNLVAETHASLQQHSSTHEMGQARLGMQRCAWRRGMCAFSECAHCGGVHATRSKGVKVDRQLLVQIRLRQNLQDMQASEMDAWVCGCNACAYRGEFVVSNNAVALHARLSECGVDNKPHRLVINVRPNHRLDHLWHSINALLGLINCVRHTCCSSALSITPSFLMS